MEDFLISGIMASAIPAPARGDDGEHRVAPGVLILIRQMAASGVARGEIATRLRDDFNIWNAPDVVSTALES
jgi:hypothetical protein